MATWKKSTWEVKAIRQHFALQYLKEGQSTACLSSISLSNDRKEKTPESNLLAEENSNGWKNSPCLFSKKKNNSLFDSLQSSAISLQNDDDKRDFESTTEMVVTTDMQQAGPSTHVSCQLDVESSFELSGRQILEDKLRRKSYIYNAYSGSLTHLSTQTKVLVGFKRTPSHLAQALLAVLFCAPLGVCALYHSCMVILLAHRLELVNARKHSIESNRYSVLAVVYGTILLMLIIIFILV